MISGGRAVARALLAAGVDHAFCVPGESFLGLLDALYDTPQIRVIVFHLQVDPEQISVASDVA